MDVKSLLSSSDEQSLQLQEACTKLHEERNLNTSSIVAHLREFQKTYLPQNADALSRLPSGKDPIFDKEEEEDDSDVVCAIENLSQQIQSTDSTFVQNFTCQERNFKRSNTGKNNALYT